MPKGAPRRQWPNHQEKALRKEFRKEMMEGRLSGQDVCLEAIEVSSSTKVAGYQRQSADCAGQRCRRK